jgi:hypothetical protein
MKDDNPVCLVFDVLGNSVCYPETVHATSIGDKVLGVPSSNSKQPDANLSPQSRGQL